MISQIADHAPPYAFGTVREFQLPPSMTRLPKLPNGVSALAANAATLAGSTYTECSKDGTSHGRQPATRAARAITVFRTSLISSTTGTSTSPVITIDSKPLATAGSSATQSQPAHRHGGLSFRNSARSTHGRPA